MVKPARLAPGIMARKDGGFLVWAKVRGKHRQRVLLDGTLRDAQRARQELIDELPIQPVSSRPLFATFAASLYRRKVEQRKWKSPATRDEWKRIIEKVLVPGIPANPSKADPERDVPGFGHCPVDAITRGEVEQWKTRVVTLLIESGQITTTTANTWLSKLFQVLRDAVAEFSLERDPTLRVSYFDETDETIDADDDPNALTVEQTVNFLAEMRRAFPQFYAVTLLGMVTGLRPSTLRPLRRSGPDADVDWDEATLWVRRSNARRQEIMKGTKQRTKYQLGLPHAVMDVLDWHVRSLKGVRASEDCVLLFPSRGSKSSEHDVWMMSRSALDKPFRAVSATIKLGYDLTPKGMRRTFQDLCRAVGVTTELQQAICGHTGRSGRDDELKMTKIYSTYRVDETRAAIGKLVAAVLPKRRAA